MIKNLCLALALLCSTSLLAQETFTISGHIREEGSEESLIGANAVDLNRRIGSSANSFGFYSIKVPADSIYLAFSFIGYETQYFRMWVSEDVTLDVFLKASSDLLGEVELIEDVSIERDVQMSSIDVPVQQIKNLPALMGEVDVMKVIQLLPGVQSGSEGNSGIYVRGGGADQNLILLDGVPVYNASHLFGFFSVFNSDAVKNVQLTKGGFPARYGGRLSSVVAIDMKDGNRQEWGGSASIGLIASRAMIEGPVIKGKSSLMVAARRTYLDVLIQPIVIAASDGGRAGYFFGDLNVKYNHDLGSKDKLYLSLYTGKDKFYSKFKYNDPPYTDEEDIGLGWGNITSALRWNHIFSPSLFGNVTATYSRYKFNISAESTFDAPVDSLDEYFGLEYISNIEDLGLKADFEYSGISGHMIRYGASYTNHTFRPGAITFEEQTSDVSVDSTLALSKHIFSNDIYVYVEDEIRVNERLKLNPGLHFTMYNVSGKTFFSAQPRFGSRFMVTDDLSVKASYAFMQQYLHLLTNSNIGLPTDLWVTSTDRIDPMKAHQVAAGVARMLRDKKYEFSAEVYYKTMSDLITLDNGASFIGFSDWQDKVITGGKGESYGLELFLQKRSGNTSGWIGYTLSWSNRHFPGTQINGGKKYPYKYDRRHDLSLVVTHKFNERVDAGLTWVYGTGNALTLEQGKYYDPFNISWSGEVKDYGEKNGFRMSAYHRLDLSVNLRKQKRNGERVWNFSVYNAYARNNPFFYTWRTTYPRNGDPETFLTKISISPLIPGVSWTRTF